MNKKACFSIPFIRHTHTKKKCSGKFIRSLLTVCIALSLLLTAFTPRMNIKAAPSASELAPLLTDDEQRYLEQSPVITVACSPNKGPIQYLSSDEQMLSGISIDVLNAISEYSNLRFEFINGQNMTVMQNMLEEGTADILAGLPDDSLLEAAYSIELSSVYLTAPVSAVMKRSTAYKEISEKVLAVTVGLHIDSVFMDAKEIIEYPSIEDCIQAVQRGEADMTYGNAYVMDFYTKSPSLQGLAIVPLSQKFQMLCFGISLYADRELLTILNKAISCFPESKMQEIIMYNTAQPVDGITFSALIAANPRKSIFIFLAAFWGLFLISLFLVLSYRRKNREIALVNQRYEIMSNISYDYLYDYDYDKDILMLSSPTADLFGLKQCKIPGWSKYSHQLSHILTVDGKDLSTLYESSPQHAENLMTPTSFSLELPTHTGEKKWFRVTRVVIASEHGSPMYSIGKITDIQKEHEEKTSLLEKAMKDPLTGLYNIASFRELTSSYLEQKTACGCLLIMDIDNFKNVNDTDGHPVGDLVLKAVAVILRSQFRSDDIIGRLGGDEFVVFMKNSYTKDQISKKCSQILEQLKEIQVGNTQTITISIGISIVTGQLAYNDLYKQADNALYYAKHEGKAGYSFIPVSPLP